jgi:hypothetical protein
LGVSEQNFTPLGGRADFLRSFIWSSIFGLMRFRDGSDKKPASNFVQIKWSGKKACTLHGKSNLTEAEERQDM